MTTPQEIKKILAEELERLENVVTGASQNLEDAKRKFAAGSLYRVQAERRYKELVQERDEKRGQFQRLD